MSGIIPKTSSWSNSLPTSLTMLSEWESNEAVLIFNKIRNGIQRTKRSPSYFSTMRLLASRISLASKKFSEEMFIQLAKLLRKRTNEKISLSSLLVEKCKRTIYQARIEKDLFFL